MIVAPAGRGQQDVDRGNRFAPGKVECSFQPLRVLHHHRINNHGKGFVGREEAMPSCQHVALEPSLTQMFAQHLHHSSHRREVVVNRNDFLLPRAVFDLEDIPKAIRIGFIGTEVPEILLLGIARENVAHQRPKHPCILIVRGGRLFNFERIVRKVGHIQVDQQFSTIRMGIGPHSPITFRRECGQFREEPSLLVKQLFWFVAVHPLFQYFQVRGIGLHIFYRDLMRPEGALDREAIDLFGSSPALWSAQNDCRPSRNPCKATRPRLFLNRADFSIAGLQHFCERLVHAHGIIPFHEVDIVAMTGDDLADRLVIVTPKDGGPRNLVPIEVQDRQDCSVTHRVQKFDALP